MAAVVAMVKEEGDSSGWARPCDSCRSAASAVYCRADSAYLCPGCDARVHAANWVASRHERVWVCEACERAPASLTCKADAASLCAACDARIHAANPLASRHCRLPISPISAAGRIFGASPLLGHRPRPLGGGAAAAAEDDGEVEEDEVSSWLLLNPAKSGSQNSTGSNGFLFGGEVDEYLDLVEYNSAGENQDTYGLESHGKQDAGDGVVPGQSFEGTFDQQLLQQQGFQLEMEYAGGLYHSVSLSSLDMPDAAAGGGEAHWRPPKGTTDLFANPGIQTAAAAATVFAMDREARVHRYREKRKHRRFEKTIRYASRKAYAETRPRIKGRFAKRTSAELDAAAEHMYRGGATAENSYGVVPSLI